jgi:hypothetical protein
MTASTPPAPPAEPPPDVPTAPQPAVALGFRDGSMLALEAADPRVRAFRAIAGELARCG